MHTGAVYGPDAIKEDDFKDYWWINLKNTLKNIRNGFLGLRSLSKAFKPIYHVYFLWFCNATT